jgi:hypothetical protein
MGWAIRRWHSDHAEQLTPDEIQVRDHLDRWIAHKLVDDPESPWHGMIHLGGSKKGSRVQGLKRPINFAILPGGVMRTLRKSQYIHDLTDPEAQYVLVRNYWLAAKHVFATEWGNQKDYLLLEEHRRVEPVCNRRDSDRPVHGEKVGSHLPDGGLPGTGPRVMGLASSRERRVTFWVKNVTLWGGPRGSVRKRDSNAGEAVVRGQCLK